MNGEHDGSGGISPRAPWDDPALYARLRQEQGRNRHRDGGRHATSSKVPEALDLRLQQLNSDYEAKRHKNITLQQLEVVEARQGLFNDWLKSKGKLGGQHKVPRLGNSRKNIEELLKMN